MRYRLHPTLKEREAHLRNGDIPRSWQQVIREVRSNAGLPVRA